MQNISFEELAQALKNLRIWVMDDHDQDIAFKMRVLHPEDAAKDIFITATAAQKDKSSRDYHVTTSPGGGGGGFSSPS